MAKTTILFGVLLIVLGIIGYIGTGSQHPTALIPAWFGIVLGVLGAFALSDNPKRRMLMMHIAVTIGLLGFLGTISSIWDYVAMQRGKIFPYPIAVEDKAVMSLILLFFVLLCVRSFIVARRTRRTA